MFAKSAPETKTTATPPANKGKVPKIATVIGKGTEVEGNINFAGGLHVDGSIIGNIEGEDDANATLTVSELGKVKGDIRVPNVVLNGEVEGNVYASQRVELAPKANIHGTVYYRFLEMAMGAVVNGQLIRSEEETRKLGYESKVKDDAKKPGAPSAGVPGAKPQEPLVPPSANKP